jgi:hypothetical protein
MRDAFPVDHQPIGPHLVVTANKCPGFVASRGCPRGSLSGAPEDPIVTMNREGRPNAGASTQQSTATPSPSTDVEASFGLTHCASAQRGAGRHFAARVLHSVQGQFEQWLVACPIRAQYCAQRRSFMANHGQRFPLDVRKPPSQSLSGFAFQAGHASSILVTRSTAKGLVSSLLTCPSYSNTNITRMTGLVICIP